MSGCASCGAGNDGGPSWQIVSARSAEAMIPTCSFQTDSLHLSSYNHASSVKDWKCTTLPFALSWTWSIVVPFPKNHQLHRTPTFVPGIQVPLPVSKEQKTSLRATCWNLLGLKNLGIFPSKHVQPERNWCNTSAMWDLEGLYLRNTWICSVIGVAQTLKLPTRSITLR